MVNVIPQECIIDIERIKILQNEILQEYFMIMINEWFPNGNWKEKILNSIKEREKNNRATHSYRTILDKIYSEGEEAFSVADMDVTALVEIMSDISHDYRAAVDEKKPVWVYWDVLKDDRNAASHFSSNTSEQTKFEWAIGSLRNMRSFVDNVSKKRFDFSATTKALRLKLANTAKGRINQELARLESDYREYLTRDDENIKIERDLNKIAAGNSALSLLDYLQRYIGNSAVSSPDWNGYYKTIEKAASMGVPGGNTLFANAFFEGVNVPGYFVALDYRMAAYHYEAEMSELSLPNLLNYISLCISGYSDKVSPDEAHAMLEEFQSHHAVRETKSVNGDTFYVLVPRKAASPDE